MTKCKQLIASVMPGIFLIGYNIGTGSLTAMSKAGANFGCDLLWTVLLSCLITWYLINFFSRFHRICGFSGGDSHHAPKQVRDASRWARMGTDNGNTWAKPMARCHTHILIREEHRLIRSPTTPLSLSIRVHPCPSACIPDLLRGVVKMAHGYP